MRAAARNAYHTHGHLVARLTSVWKCYVSEQDAFGQDAGEVSECPLNLTPFKRKAAHP